MSDDVVATVQGVSKSFKLPHENHSGLKDLLVNFRKREKGYETQHALKGISFDIKKGEFFGIVGRNGSGKSTLLKLLAGIYTPDSGYIHVSGTMTPFIELGVGFNPELTGRENVYLNGALLGFGRSEMDEMYDDIVEFAEIERFMDQKLKNYSSGMQVRLAFSIAIRVKSDILILDEVLAVGDEAFQRKCLDVFERYKSEKQTIILVTHDMATVKKYCTRAILVNDGGLLAEGSPYDISEEYTRLNNSSIDDYTSQKNKLHSEDLKIALKNSNGEKTTRFNTGEKLEVTLSWPKDKKVTDAGVTLMTSLGERVYATNTFIDKFSLEGNSVKYTIDLNVGIGRYHVMAGTFQGTEDTIVDFVNHGPEFIIENKQKKQIGDGIAVLDHKWSK